MNKFKIDKKPFFLLNKLIQKVSGLDSAIGFHAEFIISHSPNWYFFQAIKRIRLYC